MLARHRSIGAQADVRFCFCITIVGFAVTVGMRSRCFRISLTWSLIPQREWPTPLDPGTDLFSFGQPEPTLFQQPNQSLNVMGRGVYRIP